jgi:flagellar hook-associated protein 3 FlgL
VFDLLDRAAAELETPSRNGGQITQTVAFGLRDVDQVLGRVLSQRSLAGATLNRIDRASDRIDERKLAAQTERSQAEDLDMVAAISRFQQQQTSYDAALRSYASVQQLSMFQYLKG